MSGLPNPGDKQRIIDLERRLAQVESQLTTVQQTVAANQGFHQQIRAAMFYDIAGTNLREYSFAEYLNASSTWVARSATEQILATELPVGDDGLSPVFFDRGRWIRIPRGAPYVVGNLDAALTGASAEHGNPFTIDETQWGAGNATTTSTLSNPLGLEGVNNSKVVCLMRDPITITGSLSPYILVAIEPA